MHRLEREDFLKFPYIALWSLLSYQAGYINAFGFLSCGRYVSHVTGFGTQIGMALATHRVQFAFELLGFPVFFILGSFTSGLLTISRIERGLKPRFDIVMSAIPFLIWVLILMGQRHQFGEFGDQLVEGWDFILLYLLTFICGLQNGCIAVLTKGQIRTTHLTGISTDIGTDLARVLAGKLVAREKQLTRRNNVSRFATLAAFAIGSISSVYYSARWEYGSLVVPLLTSVVILFSIRWITSMVNNRGFVERRKPT